ncbi:MAG: beta-propeller domain-containing protein [Clostridia bacterium]|nr:beta-propeller domain-containing protein [Clostridia bacterium]
MKNSFKFTAVLLIISVLLGILSAGCSAEPNRPFTVKDHAASQSIETIENTEITENTETNENTGSSKNAENTETAENTENTETSENTETTESAENTGETENGGKENQNPSVSTLEKKDLDTFESEQELLDFINEYYTSYPIYYEAEYAAGDMVVEEATAETAPTAAASSYNGMQSDGEKAEEREVSSTNLVDENVDEGDYVKTDGDYIYIIRDNELITVSAKGKDTEVLSYYKLFAQGEGSVAEMYIKDGRAIVIAEVTYYEKPDFISDTSFGKPVEDVEGDEMTDSYYYGYYGYDPYKSYVAVYTIDISDREKPKEESLVLAEGYLLSSRETNGKIYLVANKSFGYYYRGDPVTAADVLPEVYDTENGFRTVDATSVVRPIFENVYPNVMTLCVIDYLNGGKTETVTVLGSGSDIYMTADSLYIFSVMSDSTCVAKYCVSDTLSYVASVKVPGYTATDFSYNEYNGKFRIATTTYSYNDSKTWNGTENNIYVFNEKLEKIGELTGLAPLERIYSVRFSGDVAYLVTFRQVDPLFVIDMSENDPKVMGELKVPGFSTYLHPVGEGLLLGIGKETKDNEWTDYNGNKYTSTYTDGVKISLFDVSDPFDPQEKDVKNYIGGEYASTEAWDNHRAFVYSNAKNTGYFAIQSNDGNGFVCVTVENGKLICKTVYPSSHFSYYSGNSRICYVDDVLYFYQYNRITVFDRNTLEEIAAVTVK